MDSTAQQVPGEITGTAGSGVDTSVNVDENKVESGGRQSRSLQIINSILPSTTPPREFLVSRIICPSHSTPLKIGDHLIKVGIEPRLHIQLAQRNPTESTPRAENRTAQLTLDWVWGNLMRTSAMPRLMDHLGVAYLRRRCGQTHHGIPL